METIVTIIYLILAGACWKYYKDTSEEDGFFGAVVVLMEVEIFLIIKFLIF